MVQLLTRLSNPSVVLFIADAVFILVSIGISDGFFSGFTWTLSSTVLVFASFIGVFSRELAVFAILQASETALVKDSALMEPTEAKPHAPFTRTRSATPFSMPCLA